MPVFSVSNCR